MEPLQTNNADFFIFVSVFRVYNFFYVFFFLENAYIVEFFLNIAVCIPKTVPRTAQTSGFGMPERCNKARCASYALADC